MEGGVWLRSEESDREGRYEEGKGDNYSEADIGVEWRMMVMSSVRPGRV